MGGILIHRARSLLLVSLLVSTALVGVATALPIDVESAAVEGSAKVVVIPLQFVDVKGVNPPLAIQNLFFATGGEERSVRDYFLEVSGGALDVGGYVVPVWVTSKYFMAQYGNSEGFGSDPTFDPLFPPVPSCAMALEAAKLADPYVDYSQFVNEDGRVSIVVIHAGTAQDMGTTDLDIWSHAWGVCDENWNSGPHHLDGVPLGTYMTDSEFSPLGTNAHELGHSILSFPDLYRGNNPVGYWDLMASGSWDGNGVARPRDPHTTHLRGTDPSHLGAWSKEMRGWVEPQLVRMTDPAQTFTLAPASGSTGLRALRLEVENNACWTQRMPTPYTSTWTSDGAKYFLVEYRDPTAARYDGDRPGGIIVWFVDECADNGWWWSTNVDAARPRVQVVGLANGAIPAGEALSRLGAWSSTVGGVETDWFVEVRSLGATAEVRVGRSDADAVLLTPPQGASVSHSRGTSGIPSGRANVDGNEAATPQPIVLTSDAAVRVMVDGQSSWSVKLVGATTRTLTCTPGASFHTCAIPAGTPRGEYVLQVRATDGTTERQVDRAVLLVSR